MDQSSQAPDSPRRIALDIVTDWYQATDNETMVPNNERARLEQRFADAIAAERATADRRVAEARITALRQAAGLACSDCTISAPIVLRGGNQLHLSKIDATAWRPCSATKIHALIAAEEARHE